jgi:hypothetical protein
MNGQNYNGRNGQLGHMGRLGASITASVPRGRPYRGEQSSGLFDVPTMEDAPMAMQPVPFHPRMYAQSPAVSYGQTFDPLPLIPGVRLRSHVPVERYGIGWFGVFVAWLVTVALGCLLAANLTGHVRHSILVSSASVGSVAKPPMPPVTSPPSAAPAPPIAAAPVAATVTPSKLTVAMPPAATGPANPLPEVGIADLPRAPALASAAPARHHARTGAVAWRAPKHSAPAAAAPGQDDDDADEAADPPAEAPAPKPAPVAAKRVVSAPDSDTSDSAPAPPPKAEPAPAPAPPKPAPKVTFAAGSLEDMIQKEVEKEQKKLHHK